MKRGLLVLVVIFLLLVIPPFITSSPITACSGSWVGGNQCGREQRELDARTSDTAQNNANGICMSMDYPSLISYETETHGTSCGCCYGLTDWTGSSFKWTERCCICGSPVTVIIHLPHLFFS